MKTLVPVFAAMIACVGCSANYYLAKGRELSGKKQNRDAALYYRRAIQADPRSGEAYYQLGLTEIQLNHRREGLQDLFHAAALLPGRDDVQVTLGDFSFRSYLADPARPKALYDTVAGLADRFLAKDPRSYDGLRWKGYLAGAGKKFREAEEFFRLANSVKPMQPELILSWTHVLFLEQEQAEAERLARQLIAANKSYEPIYDELFAQYALLKKSTEAEEILRAKVGNKPQGKGHEGSVAGNAGSTGRFPYRPSSGWGFLQPHAALE
jgi:tetratricopeptide (TPR) repeat protein